MAWFLVTATTSSSLVFTTSDTIAMINIINTGSNPVTIDTVSPVVDKAGIYLTAGTWYTIDLKSNNATLKKLYAISTTWSTTLSIFTL